MRVRLDRTVCDGFGLCQRHAPEHFSLDDWGYASISGDGQIADRDRDRVTRALLDCPVHAISAVRTPRDEQSHPDVSRERSLSNLTKESS